MKSKSVALTLSILVAARLVSSFSPVLQQERHTSRFTRSLCVRSLFNFGGSGSGLPAKIPVTTADRDKNAIQSVNAAINGDKQKSPLIECEFPALQALNKLGDGSLRSTLEAEKANVEFVSKLVRGISSSPAPFLGPKVSLAVSSTASKSFLSSVKSGVKGASSLISLKGDYQSSFSNLGSDDVCVFITPSSRGDYQAARSLAEEGNARAVVVINGFAKDQKSIPQTALMAYFLKPLTYNSQIAGFLIRSYPSSWTVLDAATKEVLGIFSDQEILVRGTNTPDLRSSGRLVQKSVDERAIRARQG